MQHGSPHPLFLPGPLHPARGWLIAGLVSSCFACHLEDDRAETSRVAQVRKLPDTELAVEPGGMIQVALQALDAEGEGVNDLRAYFATSSAKLAIDGSGAMTAVVTTGSTEFSGVTGAGIAVVPFRAAADAAAGSVWLFAYLLADAGDEATANRLPALAVQAFEVVVKVPAE